MAPQKPNSLQEHRKQSTLNALAEAMQQIDPARFDQAAPLRKTAGISLRCTEPERESIQRMAAKLNLSTSDYVILLHNLAAAHLDGNTGKRRK